ncbi:MAG TPA: MFS transporter [Candidatus Ruthenibacterium merdigallinarum]|nr:MFS transporter [Candidatus Ruthenibacterium merdigallinarum]
MPPLKLNYKRTFFVGLAFMSISAFWQLYDNVIPLILKYTFSIDDASIGVVMAMDNVLALIMLPLFGKLSDRTRTRIGRRMPYILFGTAVAVACLVLLPEAERMNSLPLFFVGLGLVLVAMATYRSPAVALMPDVTPKPLRSRGNAVINLMGAVGGMLMLLTMQLALPAAVAGEAFRPDYRPVFFTLAAVMALCVAVLFWKVKEVPFSQEADRVNEQLAESDASAPAAAGGRLPPAMRRSLLLILASVALWFMGYNAVTSGFSRYATEVLGGSFSLILMVCTAAAIVSYMPVGVIASRIGRKKTILLGVAMLFTAFFAGAFFRAMSALLYVFFILAGMGWAFINVNSYPMVVELASHGDTGKYTGYYYTVSMAAQIATPILSGFLMDRVGYWTLFPYAALFVAMSFVTMLFVRHGDARPEAKKGLEALDAGDD